MGLGTQVELDQAASLVASAQKAMWAGEFDRAIADYSAAAQLQSAAGDRRQAAMSCADLSTVRDADRIVVLDRGRVVEQGTHDDLLARRALYWHLAGQQLDG